jgi:RNA polymerase sigma-70 factor (sigma-E family)
MDILVFPQSCGGFWGGVTECGLGSTSSSRSAVERCAHRRGSGTGVGGEAVNRPSAEAVLDSPAADPVLAAPPPDVLEATRVDAALDGQPAVSALDTQAATTGLGVPETDAVLAGGPVDTDLEIPRADTARYSVLTESNFAATAVEGTPGDPTAGTAVGDATLTANAEPAAEVEPTADVAADTDADVNMDAAGDTDTYAGTDAAGDMDTYAGTDSGVDTDAGVDTAVGVDPGTDVDPVGATAGNAAETAATVLEEGADNAGTNVAVGGEPSDIVTRPTDVTETLTATALVPEVRSASSVWDADRVVTEIYHGEYKSLVRLAVLLVHDVQTAEEVVQDAFEAMHTAWRRLRDSEKALSYLRQAVVNRSRSVLRHRTVVDKNAPKPAPDEPSAEQAAMTLLERSAVVAALRTLPDRQREAIVLRYYADLSEADIAATMGISKGAVKSHTARAMAALKSILEQETS